MKWVLQQRQSHHPHGKECKGNYAVLYSSSTIPSSGPWGYISRKFTKFCLPDSRDYCIYRQRSNSLSATDNDWAGFSGGQKRVWRPRSQTSRYGRNSREYYYIATARIYMHWCFRRMHCEAPTGAPWITTRNGSDVTKHKSIPYQKASYRPRNHEMF